MVDKVLLLRKLAELEEYLRQIKEYANVSGEEYSKDWRIQRIVERTLQMMIETCADIAGHIISDRESEFQQAMQIHSGFSTKRRF